MRSVCGKTFASSRRIASITVAIFLTASCSSNQPRLDFNYDSYVLHTSIEFTESPRNLQSEKTGDMPSKGKRVVTGIGRGARDGLFFCSKDGAPIGGESALGHLVLLPICVVSGAAVGAIRGSVDSEVHVKKTDIDKQLTLDQERETPEGPSSTFPHPEGVAFLLRDKLESQFKKDGLYSTQFLREFGRASNDDPRHASLDIQVNYFGFIERKVDSTLLLRMDLEFCVRELNSLIPLLSDTVSAVIGGVGDLDDWAELENNQFQDKITKLTDIAAMTLIALLKLHGPIDKKPTCSF